MSNLIEALQIFLKYEDDTNPLYCNNEELIVTLFNTDFEDMSYYDIQRLEELGFNHTYEYDDCSFITYRYQ